MNKTNASVLIILLFVSCACSKFGSNDKSKSTPTPATTASPIAEKSVESATNQTSKENDNKPTNAVGNKDIAELEETVRRDDKNFQAHFDLGKKYQTVKNEEKAINSYKKAIEVKPDFAEANYELGKVYFNKKDFETSLPFLQKAAKVKDTSPLYLVALGDNFRELKRCNFAMPPYGNSLSYDDKNPAVYYSMGLCYLELKNRLAADAQIRPLEKLDKNLAKQLENKVKQAQ